MPANTTSSWNPAGRAGSAAATAGPRSRLKTTAAVTAGKPPTNRRLGLRALQRRHRQAGGVELGPVVLGRLARAGPDDRLAAGVDLVGDPVALVEVDARQHLRQRRGDVLEGVVVVVAHDHVPITSQARIGAGASRAL